MNSDITIMKPSPASRVIDVAHEQTRWQVDEKRLADGVQKVLEGECVDRAEISIAVVDDPAIHEINRRFLNHDEPTDVISFVLDRQNDFLQGEIIVSADTAARRAADFGWALDDELLLYVIHGALHLAGYDDLSPDVREVMRERERFYLAQFGLDARYEESPASEGNSQS